MIRFIILALLGLSACGGSGGGRYDEYDNDYSDAVAEDAAAAEEEAAEEARQTVYAEHGADTDGSGAESSNVEAYEVDNSGDYSCTQDCSGHEAGFEWAQQNDVTDTYNCGGNSQSFIEGCEAFAEQRQEQADNEANEAAEMAAIEAVENFGADERQEEADSDDGRFLDGRY